jgi:protein-S-isoprenylcysteine O-methyltransferase Ste14
LFGSAEINMSKRLSRWGVGPRILGSAAIYAVSAAVVSHNFPNIFVLSTIPYGLFVAVGVLLLAIGIPMLAIGVRAMTIAYNGDQLATEGIYGVVRNPIYSAWIAIVIPGLTMFSQSWLVLLTPLVAYSVFKLLIGREERYLADRFGQEYEAYRSEVNEIIPCPRFRR